MNTKFLITKSSSHNHITFKKKILLFTLFIGIHLSSIVYADTFYVETNTGNDSNPGTLAQPWKTISKANNNLSAGDTVYIKGGTYTDERIKPVNSGTSPSNMIIYSNYSNDTVVLTGQVYDYPVNLNNRNYIKVNGINIDNTKRFIEMDNSSFNIIENLKGDIKNNLNAGYISIFLYNGSNHNKILNSTFNNNPIGDTIRFSNAKYNLIEGNSFYSAGHALINIRGSYNIIRNNVFDNPIEKCTEIAWQVTGGIASQGEAEYNVFEKNIIKNFGPTYNYDGLQLTAPRNIIRFNEIFNGVGSGIGISTTGSGLGPTGSSVDPYGDNNRIFHNTIYNNGIQQSQSSWNVSCGIVLREYNHDGTKISNNKIINNLFYKNHPNYINPNYYANYCTSNPDCVSTPQINFGKGNVVNQINVENNVQGAGNIFGDNQELLSPNFNQNSNQDYLDPLFIDENNFNFRLSSASPYIDKGDFLTTTTGNGSGTVVNVNDAMFFSDGNEIVTGDTIQIGNNIVTITGIDYLNNQITIDSNISWNSGENVSFPYNGNRPDMGVHEFSTVDLIAPEAPLNLRIVWP